MTDLTRTEKRALILELLERLQDKLGWKQTHIEGAQLDEIVEWAERIALFCRELRDGK